MKSKVTSFFFWCLVALVLVYLFVSIVPSIFSTQEMNVLPAESIVYDEVLPIRGIALREEIPLTVQDEPTTVDYKVRDGSRVAKGDAVAVYRCGDVSTSDRLAVEAIDREIDLLTESLSTTTQFDLSTLEKRTKAAITDYLQVSAHGDLSQTRDAADEIVSYMIKRDIKAGGDRSYYEQILKNCEASKTSVLSGSTNQKSVSASQAGYFSAVYDGYEYLTASECLNGETELTPKSVASLLDSTPQARPSGYVGKLQHFSFWNFVCTLREIDVESHGITVGKNLTLRFETALYGTKTVTMTVKKLSAPADGSIAAVLESPFFDQAIYSLRICDAEILLDTHDGFRINKDSIRVVDGKNGVFVLSGATLIFKPVDILYTSQSGDFCVVVPANPDDPAAKQLLLNDSVVVGGKDIYDGKVVNIN